MAPTISSKQKKITKKKIITKNLPVYDQTVQLMVNQPSLPCKKLNGGATQFRGNSTSDPAIVS